METATAVYPLTFAYVVVSVADMDEALGLWVDRFGMEMLARCVGDDASLAGAWGLAAGDVVDQALLRTPGVRQGGLHLVRFRVPGAAVREDAAPTDLVPKSIDIAVRDIQARHDELSASGYRFRSPVGRMVTQSGIVLYEVHMFGPDGLNLVLLEVPDHPEPTSDKGYGVAPQLVVISPDNAREAQFLQSLLGLEQIAHNRLGGPSIEKTVGLPPGAQLDIRVLGDSQIDYGRIEIVQYEGAPSRNLYPRARPPARGMLSVTYFVPEVDSVVARGAALGVRDLGAFDGIYGRGRLVTATTPAGLRLDLFAPQRDWYRRPLGIEVQEWGGTAFRWCDADGKPVGGTTIWSVDSADGDYFAPSKAPLMINYRVADLHALVKLLREEGCQVLDRVDESEFGKFASVIDPEGNKVELWEPPPGQ